MYFSFKKDSPHWTAFLRLCYSVLESGIYYNKRYFIIIQIIRQQEGIIRESVILYFQIRLKIRQFGAPVAVKLI